MNIRYNNLQERKKERKKELDIYVKYKVTTLNRSELIYISIFKDDQSRISKQYSSTRSCKNLLTLNTVYKHSTFNCKHLVYYLLAAFR